MASVYTNDLRLEEIGSGEQSGTWGDTTNTNLELIAEAFAFGTEAITTNADTHTTTIADGATDPGRSLFLKYTGTLDSACTITIGPNTVSKLWFIENGTSGSQNIIISQGSGANITIPAGQTKAIYSNGAGSGAAMVDAFATLNVVDLLVDDDLAVTGVLTTTAATVFNGGFTANVASTISTDGNEDTLVLKSNDADANSGPKLQFNRNSANPADGDDLGEIRFSGRNDAGQAVEYATFRVFAADVSDGTEDTEFEFTTILAGTEVARMTTVAAETVFNQASADIDFRVESNDIANMLFLNAGTNQVGIGGVPVGVAPLHVEANFTTNVTNAATMIAATTFSVNGNTSEGSDILRIGPVTSGGAYFIEVSNGGGSAVYPLLLNPINGGRIGINTLAPENTFHVSGQTNGDYAAKIEHAGAAPYGLEIDFSAASPNSASREFIYMQDATQSKCIIHSTGDITNRNGTYGQISDVKLKENIVDANSQWDDLKAIRVRNFSFKAAELDAPNMIGLIAQEVEAAGMNGLVGETPDRDEDMEETGTVTKNVKSSILYMKAIKALQEAMTRIETLEAKVAVLEG